MHFLFFFFQAEDGIRDLTVTGVQTCALPISAFGVVAAFGTRPEIGRAVEDAKRRRAHEAREFLGRNQRCGLRHVALPWLGERRLAQNQMVFCGSGGTATVPPVWAGAGAEVAGGGLSWPTSGWLAVVVVFLVFFFVVVGAALG